jgi:hypothetical protein
MSLFDSSFSAEYDRREQLEPWETEETRARRDAWRSSASTERKQENQPLGPAQILAFQKLVRAAPMVLRDALFMSLLHEVHHLKLKLAESQAVADRENQLKKPLDLTLVRAAVNAASSAGALAFGEALKTVDIEIRNDADLSGEYVSVGIYVDLARLNRTLGDAHDTFYATLEAELKPEIARKAVFNILTVSQGA